MNFIHDAIPRKFIFVKDRLACCNPYLREEKWRVGKHRMHSVPV
jgi:hypothetical protein